MAYAFFRWLTADLTWLHNGYCRFLLGVSVDSAFVSYIFAEVD